MSTEPLAPSDMGTEAEKAKLRAVINRRGLGGLANTTKWNELLDFIRASDGWTPSYRYKCIDAVNGYIAPWDVEWWGHLPYPMIAVEWFDIGMHEPVHQGHLLPTKTIDHSPWILAQLDRIGFEYEVAADVVRIWGYAPKSYEDFPPKD
jgi:hypothetical protein